MVKKKILITGGSGYIGSRLSLYLSQKGFDMIPLCNSKIPDNKEWVQSMCLVLQGDLRDKATLNKIEVVRPDAIIHLVSLDHNQSGINVQQTLQVNVQSTWDLLSLSESIGLEKFIYFSTTQVYGQISESVVTENTKLNPINAYGLTHKMSEDLVDFYKRSKNLDAVSLRLSNSYGEPVFFESISWDLAVNYICKSAFFDQKIVLKSDGTDKRDFIHYSSICSVIEKVLGYDFPLENVYNLCEGTSISILHLAILVRNIYFIRFKIHVDIYINKTTKIDLYSYFQVNQKTFSNEKLNSILNIRFIGLEKGVNLIFDYLEHTSKHSYI
jgi:UDP-glucose 4-epimerase